MISRFAQKEGIQEFFKALDSNDLQTNGKRAAIISAFLKTFFFTEFAINKLELKSDISKTLFEADPNPELIEKLSTLIKSSGEMLDGMNLKGGSIPLFLKSLHDSQINTNSPRMTT